MRKTFWTFLAIWLTALFLGVSFLFLDLALHPRALALPLTPKQYLKEQCLERGCDFALLDAIITCESQWRMIKNSSSSAYGYFQILDSTERTTPQYDEGGRKYDPYTNLDMGIFLYESRGTNPWNESKGCWLPRYSHYASVPKQCIGHGCP